MNEENTTTQAVALNTKEGEAAKDAVAPEKTEEPAKLSRRDALEVAIDAAKSAEPKKQPSRPVKKKEVVITERKETPKYEAPSEFTQEEKEFFSKSTPEQQATSLRLFKGHQDRRAQLGRELQEHSWVKKLADDVVPFLKSTGEKMTPQEALTAALKLRKELEEGNPVENAMRYLKRKGIEVPEGLAKLAKADEEDPKFSLLQKEIESLKLERQTENLQREAHGFLADWETFQTQENAAKLPRFPDVNNSESGQKLAGEIGSLVGGKTEISKQFIAKVAERLPKAGRVELFTEAYRFLGGRIDDSKAIETKAATQNHLQRSNRAASSIPGSGSAFNPAGRVKLSRREALERAWKERQENN